MKTVKNWQEVIDNLRQFQYIAKHKKSIVLSNFTNFANWYYFPTENRFAPGKFIGYVGTSVSSPKIRYIQKYKILRFQFL